MSVESTTTLRLFDWGPSPFCMKVRAILEYKELEYRRESVLGRPLVELYRRGRIGKVPALEIDGELFCDSTDIAHELERRWPSPPILPAAARERALCHLLEDWADESLYFVGLYFQWIVGDAPFLCDFAVAAQLHYLRRTPHGRHALEPRASLERYSDRMHTFRRTDTAGSR